METKFKVGDWVIVDDYVLQAYSKIEYSNKPVKVMPRSQETRKTLVNVAIPNNSDGGLNVEPSMLTLANPIPEKWYIRITDENTDVLKEWWKNNNPDPDRWEFHSAHFLLSKHYRDSSMLYNSRLEDLLEDHVGYTEITAEQLLNQSTKEMKTYKVTREQLAEIYNIACSEWKTKIENLTTETLGAFGQEGELTEETVQSMRDAATDSQRPVIDRIFPMPVKRKVQKQSKYYLNIYANRCVPYNNSRDAERNASKDVLAVGVEVTASYEVEEDI